MQNNSESVEQITNEEANALFHKGIERKLILGAGLTLLAGVGFTQGYNELRDIIEWGLEFVSPLKLYITVGGASALGLAAYHCFKNILNSVRKYNSNTVGYMREHYNLELSE